jgi:hypothetical protein
VVSIATGMIIAVCLLWFWMASASAPWSSDPWLTNAAMLITLAGPLALIALPIVLAWNYWRQKK